MLDEPKEVKEGVTSFNGEVLKSLRSARGLSHDALARLAGVRGGRWQLIPYEKGTNKPGPSMLVQLAEALAVAPIELTTMPPRQRTLVEHRQLAGLSRPRLAEQIQMDASALRRIELGEMALSVQARSRLACALEISEEEAEAAYQRGVDQVTKEEREEE